MPNESDKYYIRLNNDLKQKNYNKNPPTCIKFITFAINIKRGIRYENNIQSRHKGNRQKDY